MLVVAAIIIVITGVIFSGRSQFNNSILLSSTAYDIALTMRDAETYGLGTRAASGAASAGYGLDFTRAAPGTYTLFADTNPAPGGTNACHALPTNGASAPNAYPGDCVYTAADTTVSNYTLGNGVTVSNFCAHTSVRWLCSTTCGATSPCVAGSAQSQLDIVFLRPNATPFIALSGTYQASQSINQACLAISAPGNATARYIYLSASGQIIANATSCP